MPFGIDDGILAGGFSVISWLLAQLLKRQLESDKEAAAARDKYLDEMGKKDERLQQVIEKAFAMKNGNGTQHEATREKLAAHVAAEDHRTEQIVGELREINAGLTEQRGVSRDIGKKSTDRVVDRIDKLHTDLRRDMGVVHE